MKKIWFLPIIAFVFLVGIRVNAQENTNYNRIDRHAKNAPDSISSHLISLHTYLISETKTEIDQLRAFYVWIVSHINYNTQQELIYDPRFLFYIGSVDCSSPSCVLLKKKAVCEGFSNLFQAFCQLSDIECYTIGGYLKKSGIQYDRATHAWNVVKLDNNWLFFDLTWGNAAYQQNKMNSPAVNSFFMVSPEEFILTHLPLIPLWQFLKTPVPLSVFIQDQEQIKKHLTNSRDYYSFEDSLTQYKSLSSAGKKIKTAREIYVTNPSNNFNQAIEYYRFAKITLHYQQSQVEKDTTSLIEAKETIKRAILLFNKGQDISSKLMTQQATVDLQIIQNYIDQVTLQP